MSSALWVQCSFVACYLLYGLVRALFSYGKSFSSSFLFLVLAVSLIYMNSSGFRSKQSRRQSDIAVSCYRVSLVIAELYNTCSFPENGKAINIAVFKVVSLASVSNKTVKCNNLIECAEEHRCNVGLM